MTDDTGTPLDERDTALHCAFLGGGVIDPPRPGEIPDGAVLVLLPDDDPELAGRNRARGLAAVAAGQNVYFRHVHRAPAGAAAG